MTPRKVIVKSQGRAPPFMKVLHRISQPKADRFLLLVEEEELMEIALFVLEQQPSEVPFFAAPLSEALREIRGDRERPAHRLASKLTKLLARHIKS